MTCKDCIHNDVCEALEMNGLAKVHPIQCGFYTDRSRYVELPCKVGDKVYWAEKCCDDVEELTISAVEVSMTKGNDPYIWFQFTKDGHREFNYQFSDSSFGREAFLAKEEAEQALAKMKGGE